jgi:hypothetical protein
MDIEHIESKSRLLQACREVGAEFKGDHIRLADGEKVNVIETNHTWRFSHDPHVYLRPLSASTYRLKALLLTIHLNILKKKID